MLVKITCTPLVVEERNFKDKDGKRVDFAIITFSQLENDKETAFTANTTKTDIIQACIKGKGKLVELPFRVIRTETGFKLSVA